MTVTVLNLFIIFPATLKVEHRGINSISVCVVEAKPVRKKHFKPDLGDKFAKLLKA